MNILYFTEYFPESEDADITGGVETRVYYLAKELGKKHNVTVITTTKNKPRVQNFANFLVIRCKTLPYTRTKYKIKRLLTALKIYKTGEKFIKKNKIDVIDAHNFFTYYPAYKLAKKYKIKSFVTYHETWLNNWVKNTGTKFGLIGEAAERFVIKNLKKSNTRFIANSNYTKSRLVKIAKITPSKIKVIHSGVELEKYRKIKVKKFRDPTIVSLGRLTSQKRIQDLIRAVKIIKQEIPNIKCKIIGDGPEKERLMNTAKKLNIENNVEFLGFISKNEEVIKILKQSHIFSLSSILEGLGLVTIEAMASGIPFVSSNITPTREISENGKAGLLYTPKDYKDLANKIINLLKDKKLYEKKQREAITLSKKYDWKILAKKLEKEYLY